MRESKYKAGSAKQLVWEAFTKEGETPALEKGLALRVSETRVRRWIGRWKKRPEKHTSNRKRVFDVGNPNLFGSVAQEGPDVSEVDWDNGMTSFVANNMLLPVGTFTDYECDYAVMHQNSIIQTTDLIDKAIRIAKKDAYRFIYSIESGIPNLIPRSTWGEPKHG